MKSFRGFTLVELLIVIAIIGILAGIVLAALSSARGKGNDAGVRDNLHTVETQSVLYYDTDQTYGSFDDGSGNAAACPLVGDIGSTVFHDTTVENAIASALLASQGGATYCHAADSTYAVSITRPTGSPSIFWCLDSTGVKCGNDGGGSGLPIEAGVCVACTSDN